jgi:CubicO group peptidase (beta-lactamase class C family)
LFRPSDYFYDVKLSRLSIRNLSVALLSGLIAACSNPKETRQLVTEDPIIRSISQYLDWEAENGFSGVVLVSVAGKEPLIRSYGYANDEQLIQNSPSTAFDIGSITKQFTGAAILKLEMMGKLKVQDSIGKYLAALPVDKQGITFHQLLTHTSGLPYNISSETEVINQEGMLTRIGETPLINPPGSQYLYSHTGYNLLGILIEVISGTDYEHFLLENLFKPARMRMTGYRLPDWNAGSIAHGYRFCNDWGSPMDAGWLEDGPSWNRRASGGMLSTISDLYAWHLALLGNSILDESAKSKYYNPQPSVNINEVQLAGYGWRNIETSRKTRVIAHNGWNGRFYSDFMRYLDEQVTIILMSNKFRDGNQSIPFELARCIFWKDYQPNLAGRLTQCLDTLPDNHLGFLAGSFINLLTHGEEKDFQEFIDHNVASHLIKKFGNDTLRNRLCDLRKTIGQVNIKRILLTDNQWMRIEVELPDRQKAFIQLFFDKNEDYRIRGFRFDTADAWNQG